MKAQNSSLDYPPDDAKREDEEILSGLRRVQFLAVNGFPVDNKKHMLGNTMCSHESAKWSSGILCEAIRGADATRGCVRILGLLQLVVVLMSSV